MKQKILGAILIGICVCLVGIYLVCSLNKDTNPPTIEFTDEAVKQYTNGQTPAVLLLGVKATDGEDGNVTDDIMIEGIYDFHDGRAKITYAVRDKAGNIGKAERMVTFIGGSLSAEAKKAKAATQDAVEAVAEVSSAGTETESNATEATQPNPVLQLTQNQVTIKKGADFSALDYVDKVTDDKDSESELSRRIQVKGNYNANKAGTYQISFSVTDSDGNKSNVEKFTLTVQ